MNTCLALQCHKITFERILHYCQQLSKLNSKVLPCAQCVYQCSKLFTIEVLKCHSVDLYMNLLLKLWYSAKLVSHTIFCHNYSLTSWHLIILYPYDDGYYKLTAVPLHCTLAFQYAGAEQCPSVYMKGCTLRCAAIISCYINKGDWGLFDWTVTQAGIKGHIWPPTRCSEQMLIHPLCRTSSLVFRPKRPVCLTAECRGPVGLANLLAGVLGFSRIRHPPASVEYLWFDLCRVLAEGLM